MKKLKKGQTFKNWKEVCEWFDWKTTGGDTKKAYLKEFESLCEYHKEGNKFIIDKVFNKPKQIKDGRKTIDYMDKIETQIVKMLIDENEQFNGVNIKTTYYLLQKLGMVNNLFKEGSFRLDKSSTYLDIPIEVADELFKNTKDSHVYAIENAFNNLAKKKIIKWEKIYSINLQEEIDISKDVNITYGVKTDIDEYGNEHIVPIRTITVDDSEKIKQIQRIATDYELGIILDSEKKALQYFDVSDISGLYKKHISITEYYAVSEMYIRKKIPTFINYWRSYKIIYNNNNLLEYIKENKVKSPNKNLNEINTKVQESIKERAKNRIKKAKNRKDSKYNYRLEDDFIQQVDDFNKTFISLNNKISLEEFRRIKPNYKHYEL